MDELDFRILEGLSRDARRHYLDLANELGVSDATVHKRVRKLVDDGIIRGFVTVVDEEKLGYKITAFIEVVVQPGSVESVVPELCAIDGVLEAHELHGHCDILLKVRARDLGALRDKLVNRIRAVDEVTSTEAFPVLRVAKEEYQISIGASKEGPPVASNLEH
jgi:Lrp/AsnC family transcriptional regulator for asnA, asnC and gidA